MARPPDAVTVRRAALLLRCQQAREERQRAAVLAAERAHADARAGVAAAAEALRVHNVRAAQARDAAHEALLGRLVAPSALMAVARLERDLGREAKDCAECRVAADARLQATGVALAAARDTLAAVTRASAKRMRLAEALSTRFRRARDLAEENGHDEDRADAWRPA